MSDDVKKCFPLDHPALIGNWGCCQCKTLNGDNRSECKYCGHSRCDDPKTKTVVYEKPGGGIVMQTIQTPSKDTATKNR